MSSGDSRNPRRWSPRRSPSWENYERFDNGEDEDETQDDIFDIPPKKTPWESLRKWRQATLALNASRRFRYTFNLKRAEERELIKRKIRAHAQAVRAAHLFKKATIKANKEEGIKIFLVFVLKQFNPYLQALTKVQNLYAKQMKLMSKC